MENRLDVQMMQEKFGEKFQSNISIARFTSARIGGVADGLLTAKSVDDLIDMVSFLWENNQPFIILGGGSNVLVSDAGVRGVVILNQARELKFD